MKLIRLILLLVVLVFLFFLCLLFVVSNPQSVTLNLLVTGWQFELTLGVLLLLTLGVGLVLGYLLQKIRHWLFRLLSDS